jgi:hypothetical protein
MFSDANLALLITLLLGVLGMVGLLAYVMKGTKIIKEVADALMSIAMALQDGKVTAEEIMAVKKEFDEVKAAFAELVVKKGTAKK